MRESEQFSEVLENHWKIFGGILFMVKIKLRFKKNGMWAT